MSHLISDYRSIFFDFEKVMDGCVRIVSIDLSERKRIVIEDNSALGFDSCYWKVVAFHEDREWKNSRLQNPSFLLLHMSNYRNCLYGIHMETQRRKSEALTLFKEAYIACFSLELAMTLEQMSMEKIEELKKILYRKSDEIHAEVDELAKFFERWRLLKGT